MKLYLISDDIGLRARWMSIFALTQPKILSAMSSDIDENSILFVSDTLLKNGSEEKLLNLFRHRVMVLSMVPDFNAAQNFLAMGAMGYGNAMMHESYLHSALQALEEGKVWLHPDFIALMILQIQDQDMGKKKSLALLDDLSKREREVALMLSDGTTHQSIADALDITVRTVKAHASSIYQKLDVKDRLALSLLLHT